MIHAQQLTMFSHAYEFCPARYVQLILGWTFHGFPDECVPKKRLCERVEAPHPFSAQFRFVVPHRLDSSLLYHLASEFPIYARNSITATASEATAKWTDYNDF